MHNIINIRPYRRAQPYITIGNRIGGIALTIKRMRLGRKTVRELEQLSDHQLEDIGIPRAAIREVAKALINGKARPIGHAASARMPVAYRQDIEQHKIAA